MIEDIVFYLAVGVFVWWFCEALVRSKGYRRVIVGEKDYELDHILKGEGER